MADKQIQIGVDELEFVQSNSTGINCPGTSPTPTPSPTIDCATLNLKSQIACDKYIVEDVIKSVSSDKAMSMFTLDDDSIILGGYGVCSTILDSTSTQRGIISKLKKNILKTTDPITNTEKNITKIDLDQDFGTKGKINAVYYNSNSLKVAAKFGQLLKQSSSGQNKIVAIGQADYQPLVARFSETGAVDRTFGAGSGYVMINNIQDNIKLLDIFGSYIQPDNKILLFCNAYDLQNSRSLCVIIRLTNSGTLDQTFNNNKIYIELRSPKPEFNGNKFIGKNIIVDSDDIFIVFECFSSIKKNTVIITKYNLTTEQLYSNFASEGYLYCNLDSKDTTFQNIFTRSVNIDLVNTKLLYVILNANKKYLQINKYTTNGIEYDGKDSDTPEIKALYNNLKIDPNNSPDAKKFSVKNTTTQTIDIFSIDFDNTICNNMIINNGELYLLFNLYITERVFTKEVGGIKTTLPYVLGKTNNSMNHWRENESLFNGSFSYSDFAFRDCITLKCDRIPEDTYGTVNIKSQEIRKYNTSTRILFGVIKLDSNVTEFSPIKLERFNNLEQHNIIKNIVKLSDNTYVAAGYCGDSTYSNFAVKTISLTEDTTTTGPKPDDAMFMIDFSDFCAAAVAFEDSVVVEECPCAPQATPTPTPTPPATLPDVVVDTIEDLCVDNIPNIKINWIKNRTDLAGQYLVQITQNTSNKEEIVSGTFSVAQNTPSGSLNISLGSVDTKLDKKTCVINILNIAGQIIYSKIFVLTIRNCSTTT